MRRILLSAIIVSFVVLPIAGFSPVSAQPQHKALIMSSLEQYVPMGYVSSIESLLSRAGYQVTFLSDRNVTLNLLVTQLNNYEVIIWRTNVYMWSHTTYWYVGEESNAATSKAYAADFAAGRVDDSNGILGISQDFFQSHFNSKSLSNVKLAFVIGTMSSSYAGSWVYAGAKAVIDCTDGVSLEFGNIDYYVGLMINYLAHGVSVQDTLYDVIVRWPLMNAPQDPLDSINIAPMWFTGNGTVTLT